MTVGERAGVSGRESGELKERESGGERGGERVSGRQREGEGERETPGGGGGRPRGGGGYSDNFIHTQARAIFWGSKF